MLYIFEKGQYPTQIVVDEKEFANDNDAVEHAKIIDADYVWDCPNTSNPSTVYVKSRK